MTHHLNHENEEYALELIPVKYYKKGLVFLVTKAVKNITNHSIAS